MNYKVGDKVQIIKNNGGQYFNQFIGKIVTITKIDDSETNRYYLNIPPKTGDYGSTSWEADEFEFYDERLIDYDL